VLSRLIEIPPGCYSGSLLLQRLLVVDVDVLGSRVGVLRIVDLPSQLVL
jgi:hypothetical protein